MSAFFDVIMTVLRGKSMKKLNQFLLSVIYLHRGYMIKNKCDKNMMFKIKESEYYKIFKKTSLYIQETLHRYCPLFLQAHYQCRR